jgi:acyl carrier protein
MEDLMNVFEKVKKLIVDELNVKEEKVQLDTHLVDDLGADSLDAVELIMAIEDEFDIEINDEVAQNMKTVRDIVTHLENLE